MEVHQLRYFVAVAEEGGFSLAAERVHVAQPSLSQQIQKLEAEIGQRLFDRLSRGVSLTEAGQKLLPFARRILMELSDAQRSVDECQQNIAGTVALGIIPTVAPYIIRPLLRACAETYPGVTLHLLEDVTERLVRALEQGELDVALVSNCRAASGMHREFWQREPLLLMVPRDHPETRKKRVSLRALREERFLSLHESHCLSRQIERWCRLHQITNRTTQPALQLSTVVAMVAAGQGVSLLPAMAIADEQARGCAFLPLHEAAPPGPFPEPRCGGGGPDHTPDRVGGSRRARNNSIGIVFTIQVNFWLQSIGRFLLELITRTRDSRAFRPLPRSNSEDNRGRNALHIQRVTCQQKTTLKPTVRSGGMDKSPRRV